jgi:hypothetical protein
MIVLWRSTPPILLIFPEINSEKYDFSLTGAGHAVVKKHKDKMSSSP